MDALRVLLPKDIDEALREILGKPLTYDQKRRLTETLGEFSEPLNFRTWCGVCAAVERLIASLPPKAIDPPDWIEKADFETLERRLRCVKVHPKLVELLRQIRDR